MTGETYSGQEQDERLKNPDAYFGATYGDIRVVYGDYPKMPLRDLLAMERVVRGVDVDNDDQESRAVRHMQMLFEQRDALKEKGLLDQDRDLAEKFGLIEAEEWG